MNITILCSPVTHPVNKWLNQWAEKYSGLHCINIVRSSDELKKGGDILFLISCSEIITQEVKSQFENALIIHASDLPQGRGWSPHIWQIIDGASEVVLSLLEVVDRVDSGAIWQKLKVQVLKTDLYEDINKKIFDAELALMDFAVNNAKEIKPYEQDTSIEPTYYEKRTPADSELDINKSIKESFNLIRVCDPSRYPAFFHYEGTRYKLYIEKDDGN